MERRLHIMEKYQFGFGCMRLPLLDAADQLSVVIR